MTRKTILILILSVLLIQIAMSQTTSTRIRHTVVFKLKHPAGSVEEKNFITAIKKLSEIPGVENFEFMKQISEKNNFDYGVSMEFINRQAYDNYNNHPDHVAFVQNIWLKEVEDFMEIDFSLD